MGLPAAKAKAMHELMMPANTATQAPLTKLNSAMAALLLGVGELPLLPHAGQPADGDAREADDDAQDDPVPEVVETSAAIRPSKTGGTSVPKTAQKPSDRAMPSDMPR